MVFILTHPYTPACGGGIIVIYACPIGMPVAPAGMAFFLILKSVLLYRQTLFSLYIPNT